MSVADELEMDLRGPGSLASMYAKGDYVDGRIPEVYLEADDEDLVPQMLQSDVAGAGVVRGASGLSRMVSATFDLGQIVNMSWFNLTDFNGTWNNSNCVNESCLTTSEPLYPDYEDAAAMEKVLAIVVPILFGLIVVVGLFGNALVVVVVLCNPQMRSTTNLLIINLAMADLLFIIFCVPFTAWDYAFPYWPFGDIWCRIVQYLVIVCAYASIYTLVLMSLDRFLAVVHPIASMSIRTERNAYVAITFTWMVILITCIPVLEAHGEMTYPFARTNYSVCVFLASEGYNYAAFQIAFFLSSFIIPLAIIFVLYVLMLKRLWFGVAPGGHVSAESVRSKKRVTRLVVVVVVIFAVCWCPIQIVLVLKSVNQFDLTTAKIILQIASHILAYMNSCVNPILYAFLSENFRKAFRKVISCSPQRACRPRRDDYERTERETVAGNASNVTKSSKITNDIL